LSTKLHIVVDALGDVLRLLYTAGQMHESTQAEALIAGLTAENLIGDKAFDSDRFSRSSRGSQYDRRGPVEREPGARAPL